MLSKHKTKIQPLVVQDTLQNKGLFVFTSHEFSRLFETPLRKTRYFLETYTKQGLFVRLKPNLYVLKGKTPNEEVIANALYKPSYISLEYALSRYGIIPEAAYTVTSVTTKVTANFDVLGREFSYQKIKKEAYTGYTPEKVGRHTIFIAEPEKALVDYLYFVSIGRKTINDRTNTKHLDKKKALTYIKLYNRKNLSNLLEEVWNLPEPAII